MSISRRDFGKKMILSTVAAGTGLFFPGILRGSKLKDSIVVIARSDRLKRKNNNIKREYVLKVLNEALKRMTNLNSSEVAWRSLFSSKEKVGIKLSCLPGRSLSSSMGLVMAIVDGLLSAGIKGKNIFIWERTNRELEGAGFSIKRGNVNVFGTDNLYGGGYSNSIEFSGSVGTCFSRIVESVDAIINVPVLKDHDIAGVSIGMKNFFGAIYNPNKFHDNGCDPYVADLCNHPFIKNKLRLTVCDASRVQVHNGPAFFPKYVLEYGGILMSTDPVALDFMGWKIIEKGRKEKKLKSLKNSGREPTYIKTAEKLKLGRANRDYIKVIRI